MRNAIFLMGLPGAGKSTVVQERFANAGPQGTKFIWVDSDRHKEKHPDFDPANPGPIHDWSVQEALKEYWAALKERDAIVVVDGTGAHPEFVDRIREAKAAGFHTTLLCVSTPYLLCVQRQSMRPWVMPEGMMEEKLAGIEANFSIASKIVDLVEVVDGRHS